MRATPLAFSAMVINMFIGEQVEHFAVKLNENNSSHRLSGILRNQSFWNLPVLPDLTLETFIILFQASCKNIVVECLIAKHSTFTCACSKHVCTVYVLILKPDLSPQEDPGGWK